MDFTSQVIFFGSLLLLISIIASVISNRIGAPLLLVFLVIGMLLGEEGLGGLGFDDFQTAHLIGSLALAVILFDGGLRTRTSSFRVGLRPAVALATVGVVITAGLTALVARYAIGLGWLEAALIGAIVGSTDAAAVFSLLHSKGLELKQRVAATLEIESGSNDPMAIFLTVALIELLMGQHASLGWGMGLEFVQQMGLGALIGVLGGFLLAYTINGLQLTPGLYPLLALGGGLVIFGAAAVAGGSGFLAVYLAGLIVGNRRIQAAQNIQRFNDGMAWLSQITMFVMLGVLVTPSELLPVAPKAAIVGLALIFLARPLAVFTCLAPFRFPWREQLFIAWVGLRGAVPIILGIFPLVAGLAGAEQFFNVAFFVVLLSLVVQGWTIAPVARLLRLELPPDAGQTERVELDVPQQADYEFVSYRIKADSPALYKPVHNLRLPNSARVLTLFRGGTPVHEEQGDILRPGDQIYLLSLPEDLPALDRMFVAPAGPAHLEEQRFFGEFTLDGDTRLGDLAAVYGFNLPPRVEPGQSLSDYLLHLFRGKAVVGDRVRLDHLQFTVREMEGNRIVKVGLKLS
ncbi:potassium/proton antiporter (CPA1 family) [Alkalispirillum mobile]|uniref:Potassium/proton antiporter (CPA1 family) n=1 Tax=Alkalispirillum mobile TaxID=85925 RepID=A0A498C8T3_9GAMM|nr:potassium/proton antiporter [Alkalispirillum mobile]RLK48691.1 potassium/proton antiporter (CPA1 family) [Alkalispirillum mobile]